MRQGKIKTIVLIGAMIILAFLIVGGAVIYNRFFVIKIGPNVIPPETHP